jgi:hypothetical protein
MMDARFILVEIGRLTSTMETVTKSLDRLDDKVSRLERTVATTLTTGKVLVGVGAALAGGVWWLGTALWPLRHKLASVIEGS